MTAVVDASVLVAATVDGGPDGIWAENIVASGSLFAPHLVFVEATNILRKLERANQLTSLEANYARVDILHLDIELFAFETFADRIWDLRDNVTSYDAWYIAVAELVKLPLATLDHRLSRAPGPLCQFLTPP